MNRAAGLTALCFVLATPAARADEGMWTYNNFPKAEMQKRHGFAPDDKWLDHVRLSSVRLAGGCSGSIVSESGLLMTNHHCAHKCIEQLSTAEKDIIKGGFYARTAADEAKCPEVEINQLVEISDVTERIGKATRGLADQAYNAMVKAEMSRIEKECSSSDRVRCDVVTLYHGGIYNLYKYKRYQDVRLVFAPEFAIAFFGGDPDNFNFPRYDLDVSFLRLYEDGKPARMEHYLKWAQTGLKEGDLAFVSGHPGGTERQLTIAQLEYQRDVAMPDRLLRMAETRGVLTEFQRRSPEAKRISTDDLFAVENGFKVMRGRFEALHERSFFAGKVAGEKALRTTVAKDPKMKKLYAGAWDAIARAQDEAKKIRKPLSYIEGGIGFGGDLFRIARTLVRAGDELPKPLEKRFREFSDSRLPAVKQHLFSAAPIYEELEILKLTFGLGKLREQLGADDPFVKRVLGKESPDDLAARLVRGSKLKDLALRKRLWDGGKAAVDASDDPMILLAKQIDPDARAVRKKYEDEIEAVVKKNDELIAKARFAAQGTSAYPDATFTLRLSYGVVKGWEENGKPVKPITDLGGAFERATGRPPFELPETWLKARPRLDLATSFDLVTTNDIIGGNSGSPLVNRAGEAAGLVFDGNIHSLGGNFGYDPAQNRCVAVHSDALLHSLEKIYNADRIVKELRPPPPAAK
ncbi:MAG: S46 family peptidase [Myxococcales bacterium]|nr:S46 family peptidase [Myxococcales bacterium]